MALDALFRGAALERGIAPSLPRPGKLPGETGFRGRRAKNRALRIGLNYSRQNETDWGANKIKWQGVPDSLPLTIIQEVLHFSNH